MRHANAIAVSMITCVALTEHRRTDGSRQQRSNPGRRAWRSRPWLQSRKCMWSRCNICGSNGSDQFNPIACAAHSGCRSRFCACALHAAAPGTTTWQITHFLCSPLVFALAKKTTAQTAKITNATVSAPTPVEPTSSIVLHAVGTPSPARAPRQW